MCRDSQIDNPIIYEPAKIKFEPTEIRCQRCNEPIYYQPKVQGYCDSCVDLAIELANDALIENLSVTDYAIVNTIFKIAEVV